MQYLNAGQVCLAGTRVLVGARSRTVSGEGARGGARWWSAIRASPARAWPADHRDHFESRGFVERALAAGATALFGRLAPHRGRAVLRADAFRTLEHDEEIVQHEVFGPVLTWQTFGADEE